MTVICHITKYVLFIFIWNNITAADFTKLFFEHVEYYFDFSKNIVTDKNSCIISDFWQEVCKIQMIKQHLSITYHFQINSQNEILNQIIKNYLRIYISKNQIIWAKLFFLCNLFIITIIIISFKWVWTDFYTSLIARFALISQTTSLKKKYQLQKITLKNFTNYIKNCIYN